MNTPEPPLSPPDPGPEYEIELTLAATKANFDVIVNAMDVHKASLGWEDRDTGGYHEGGLRKIIVYDVRCFDTGTDINDWVETHYATLINLSESYDISLSKS